MVTIPEELLKQVERGNVLLFVGERVMHDYGQTHKSAHHDRHTPASRGHRRPSVDAPGGAGNPDADAHMWSAARTEPQGPHDAGATSSGMACSHTAQAGDYTT